MTVRGIPLQTQRFVSLPDEFLDYHASKTETHTHTLHYSLRKISNAVHIYKELSTENIKKDFESPLKFY